MKNKSQSEIVYDYLLNIILDENTLLGQKLPGELFLCKKFECSRSSVREAMSKLLAQGYVYVKKGSGTYVESKDVQTHNSNLLEINSRENLRDFMEIRISIEILAARLFIKNYSNSKMKKLEETEKDFEKSVEDCDVLKMAYYDELFHNLIIEGTDNALLIIIGKTLADSFRKYRQKTFKNVKGRQEAIKSHKKIIDSLIRKDTNETIYNIENHLIKSRKNAEK